jgi:copper(I)-binding protein
MRRRALLATAACVAATAPPLAGCSAGAITGKPDSSRPLLEVSGGYVPQPPMADMAAGYFTVTNNGGADDQLTGVTSDLAPDVTMHRTQSAEMLQVTSFTIPAGGRLVLSTGGNHLMLMNLKRRPAVGDQVSFVLRFARSSPISVRVPVVPASYRPKG